MRVHGASIEHARPSYPRAISRASAQQRSKSDHNMSLCSPGQAYLDRNSYGRFQPRGAIQFRRRSVHHFRFRGMLSRCLSGRTVLDGAEVQLREPDQW